MWEVAAGEAEVAGGIGEAVGDVGGGLTGVGEAVGADLTGAEGGAVGEAVLVTVEVSVHGHLWLQVLLGEHGRAEVTPAVA